MASNGASVPFAKIACRPAVRSRSRLRCASARIALGRSFPFRGRVRNRRDTLRYHPPNAGCREVGTYPSDSGLGVFVVGSVVASIGIAPTVALGTDTIVG